MQNFEISVNAVIWKNLVDIFKNYTDLSRKKIIDYLIPINLEDEKTLYQLYKDPTKLSLDAKKELVKFTDEKWSLDSMINDNNTCEMIHSSIKDAFSDSCQQLSKECRSKQYRELLKQNLSTSQAIRYLVFASIWGTFFPVVFDMPNIKNISKCCKLYINRSDIIKSIKESLSDNNLLIIYGEPGIGKTQLTKEFIQKSNYREVIFLTTEQESLCDLFQHTKQLIHPSNLNIEDALFHKSSSSLIIVECPTLSSNDYNYLLKYEKKGIHIICNTCVSSKKKHSIPILHLKALNKNQLYKLFCQASPSHSGFFSYEDFCSLSDFVCHNTLVISMIGKMLERFLKSHPPLGEREKLKSSLLDYRNWIWKNKNLPSVNNQNYIGIKSNYNIFYFIRTLIRQFHLSNYPKLIDLCLWTRGEMTLTALEKWCSNNVKKTIDSAFKLGLIEYNDPDQDIFTMHPFISDAIWYELILNTEHTSSQTSVLYDYQKNIQKFLSQLHSKEQLSYSYQILYNAADTLLLRLYSTLPFKKQRNFRLNDWRTFWDYVNPILTFFIESGNSSLASKLNQDLYYVPVKYGNNFEKEYDKKKLSYKTKQIICELEIKLMNGTLTKNDIKILYNQLNSLDQINYQEWIKELINFFEMFLTYKARNFNPIMSQEDTENYFQRFYNYMEFLDNAYQHMDPNGNYKIILFQNYYYFLKSLYYFHQGSLSESSAQLLNARNCIINLYQVVLDRPSFIDAELYSAFTMIIEESYLIVKYFEHNILDPFICNETIQTIIILFEQTEPKFLNRIVSKDISYLYILAKLAYQSLKRNPSDFTSTIDNIKNLFFDRIKIDDTEYLDQLNEAFSYVKDEINHYK